MAWLEPIKLEGSVVTLEPLDMRHVEPLKAAVMDGEYWKLWFANIPSPDHMENYVVRAIENAKKGDIAFAVKLNDMDKIVGTTRFYSVDESNRRPMLGYTWYAKSACKTRCEYREQTFIASICVRTKSGDRGRVPYALFQPDIQNSDRTARRQTGWRPAQPPDYAGWLDSRYGRLFNTST